MNGSPAAPPTTPGPEDTAAVGRIVTTVSSSRATMFIDGAPEACGETSTAT